jgi:DNA modification methylase
LYAIKGHKKTTAIYPDVITTTADIGLQHGAQKPVALYENLLTRSCLPGDKVLDCFAGSGTIFPAAHNLKLTAVGIEMSTEYYGICLNRLKELSNAPSPLAAAAAGLSLGAELASMLGNR